MGAFDAIECSMRPPSARRLNPGTQQPSEVHTLLQAIGRLLMCSTNSVSNYSMSCSSLTSSKLLKVNFAALTGCPQEIVHAPDYPFQMKFWPFGHREPTYLRKLLAPPAKLNSSRLRISPNHPEPWMGDHVIDHSVGFRNPYSSR